jgi:hypothetical protein
MVYDSITFYNILFDVHFSQYLGIIWYIYIYIYDYHIITYYLMVNVPIIWILYGKNYI